MSADYHHKATWLFITALCAAALAAGAWYLHSGAQYTTYRIETHDRVSGLIVDSPVEFHGVEIGRVTKIEEAVLHPQITLLHLRIHVHHGPLGAHRPRDP